MNKTLPRIVLRGFSCFISFIGCGLHYTAGAQFGLDAEESEDEQDNSEDRRGIQREIRQELMDDKHDEAHNHLPEGKGSEDRSRSDCASNCRSDSE